MTTYEKVKQKIIEAKKKKKHRHKWTYDYCDCPHCIGEHASCECGDIKNLTTGKINDF